MHLDERIRTARPSTTFDVAVDLDAAAREVIRSGRRLRRAYRASAVTATALTVALVGTLVVRSLGSNEDVSRIASTSSAGDRIVFTEWEGPPMPQCHGHPEAKVYVMKPDGSQRTVLAEGNSPRWSPDGRHIAHFRSRLISSGRCETDIWIMDADSSDQRKLTAGAYPTWSPDGERVAYSAVDGRRIEIVNTDGSPGEAVTRPPDRAVDLWPDWSPDGGRIVFSRMHGDERGAALRMELWVVDLATGNEEQLCCLGELWPEEAVWSPDGSLLAFADYPPGDGPSTIVVVRADGSEARLLTSGHKDWGPSWSSDGSRIAFTRVVDGTGQIFVTNVDGSGLRRVGSGSDPDFPPPLD